MSSQVGKLEFWEVPAPTHNLLNYRGRSLAHPGSARPFRGTRTPTFKRRAEHIYVVLICAWSFYPANEPWPDLTVWCGFWIKSGTTVGEWNV